MIKGSVMRPLERYLTLLKRRSKQQLSQVPSLFLVLLKSFLLSFSCQAISRAAYKAVLLCLRQPTD